jgi:hypothetical protein
VIGGGGRRSSGFPVGAILAGVALRALLRGGRGYGARYGGIGRGVSGPRFRHPILLVIFLVVLGIVVLGSLAGVKLAAPPPPTAPCSPDHPCGGPPSEPTQLQHLTFYRSSAFGYQLAYDPQLWTVERSDGQGITLSATSGAFVLRFDAEQASQGTPGALIDGRLGSLRNSILGMAADTDPRDAVLGPAIGYRPGAAVVQNGTVDTAQGPSVPVAVVVMAATDGGITAAVTVVTDKGAKKQAYQASDAVINSFLWPGEAAA